MRNCRSPKPRTGGITRREVPSVAGTGVVLSRSVTHQNIREVR
ncbi:MAG: hypothetical protein V7K95_27575 [Nostoc sp.]